MLRSFYHFSFTSLAGGGVVEVPAPGYPKVVVLGFVSC